MVASAAFSADGAFANGAKRSAGGGASRNIILRAVVRPFCKLSKMHHGMRLRGRTDDGAEVDSSIARDGGFTVVCNKPYAMNLERAAIWGAPAFRPKQRRAAADDFLGLGQAPSPLLRATDYMFEQRQVATASARDAFSLARASAEPQPAAGELEVVLSVDLSDGPLRSSCVMGTTGTTNFVCHAFPGADGARLPLPRMEARMGVTAVDLVMPQLASSTPDLTSHSLFAIPTRNGDARALRDDSSDTIAGLDSLVRQQRTGDRLTISVTAKY